MKRALAKGMVPSQHQTVAVARTSNTTEPEKSSAGQSFEGRLLVRVFGGNQKKKSHGGFPQMVRNMSLELNA